MSKNRANKAMRKLKEIQRPKIGNPYDDKLKPLSSCDPDCPDCLGVGFIGYEDAPGDHFANGRRYLCPRLPIDSPEIGWMTGLHKPERLLNWSNVIERENVRDAIDTVKKCLTRRRGFVFLVGGSGLAKSLILKIAVAEYLRKSRENKNIAHAYEGYYANMYDIHSTLESFFFDKEKDTTGTYEKKLSFFQRIPLLAIDELGIQTTDWKRNQEFIILNARYEAAIEREDEVLTIVATNLLPNEFMPRLEDRIIDHKSDLIILKGKSFRITKERKQNGH